MLTADCGLNCGRGRLCLRRRLKTRTEKAGVSVGALLLYSFLTHSAAPLVLFLPTRVQRFHQSGRLACRFLMPGRQINKHTLTPLLWWGVSESADLLCHRRQSVMLQPHLLVHARRIWHVRSRLVSAFIYTPNFVTWNDFSAFCLYFCCIVHLQH